MDVIEPRLDAETLAAFLDGRLSRAERERVVAVLAESPADAEALLEASRIREQIGASSGLALSSGPAGRGWIPVFAGLAAAAVIAVAIARLVPERGAPARLLAVAAGLALPQDSLWAVPPWSASRGEASALGDHTLALRVGARLADLEVAGAAGDLTTARQIAAELAATISDIPAGTPSSVLFRRLTSDTNAIADQNRRVEAYGAVGRLLGDSPWLSAGSWLAAARIAAMKAQAGYFESGGAADRTLLEVRTALLAAGDTTLVRRLDALSVQIRGGVSAAQIQEFRITLDSLLANTFP